MTWQVCAFKGMRVSEWNQRSLGAVHSSSFEVNPELDATSRLKQWWEGGGAGETVSLSQDTRGGGTGPAIDHSARSTTQELFELGQSLSAASDPIYASIR